MSTLLTLTTGHPHWVKPSVVEVQRALNEAGTPYGDHFVRFQTEPDGEVVVNAWQVISVKEGPRGR